MSVIDEPTVEVACRVNGVEVRERVAVRRSLVDWLRHDLGLTGSHVGCEQVEIQPGQACHPDQADDQERPVLVQDPFGYGELIGHPCGRVLRRVGVGNFPRR